MTYRHLGAWIGLALTALIALYLAICWATVALLITPQRMSHEWDPAENGLAHVEEVSFTSRSDGIVLRGWLVPSSGSAAVILTHGLHTNAWHCSQRDLVRRYIEVGFHVLTFDLRSHGLSGGTHAGLGVLDRGDILAAMDLLVARGVQPGQIGIHGQSYGAAVAVLAAADIEAIGAIIADSGYSSVPDAVGDELTRQTGLPAGLAVVLMPGMRLLCILLHGIDLHDSAPAGAVGRIEPRPVLIIHGTEDTFIPFEQGQRIFAAAGPSTRLWAMRGSGHTPRAENDDRRTPPTVVRLQWVCASGV